MKLRILNLTLQMRNPIGRTVARCSAWMALAIVSLAAGNAEADLIFINSGSTQIEIFTGSTGSGSGNNSITNGIHGPLKLAGFSIEIERSSYLSGNSTQQNTSVEMPFPSPVGGFLKGTAIVNFTALNNLDYFPFGGWGFQVDGDGTLDNREWNWSLRDNTSGTFLENFSRIRQNGVDSGGSNSGTQTGKLLTGRSYTYSSEFISRHTTGFDVQSSTSQHSGFTTFVTAVPEPSSAAIFGLTALGLLVRRRRR